MAEVRELASNHWPEILMAAGIEKDRLRNKHGPCPVCGGTDRFRFDDMEGSGSYFCGNPHHGAGDGLKLALNIGAMLLAFIALIALLNAPLTWLGEVTGLAQAIGKPTNLATIFGQKRNLLRRSFWAMLSDILRFNRESTAWLAVHPGDERPLGEFLKDGRYSDAFADWYL